MAEEVKMYPVRFERPATFTEPTRRGGESFRFKYTADDVRNHTVIELPEWLYKELMASRKADGAPKIVDAKPGSVVDHQLKGMKEPGTPLTPEEIEATARPKRTR